MPTLLLLLCCLSRITCEDLVGIISFFSSFAKVLSVRRAEDVVVHVPHNATSGLHMVQQVSGRWLKCLVRWWRCTAWGLTILISSSTRFCMIVPHQTSLYCHRWGGTP